MDPSGRNCLELKPEFGHTGVDEETNPEVAAGRGGSRTQIGAASGEKVRAAVGPSWRAVLSTFSVFLANVEEQIASRCRAPSLWGPRREG